VCFIHKRTDFEQIIIILFQFITLILVYAVLIYFSSQAKVKTVNFRLLSKYAATLRDSSLIDTHSAIEEQQHYNVTAGFCSDE